MLSAAEADTVCLGAEVADNISKPNFKKSPRAQLSVFIKYRRIPKVVCEFEYNGLLSNPFHRHHAIMTRIILMKVKILIVPVVAYQSGNLIVLVKTDLQEEVAARSQI